MEEKKPYLVVLLINTIYAGMFLLTKAAFDSGTSTFVFVFYRQAFATIFLAPTAIILERKKAIWPSPMILLKIFLLALVGITSSLNVYNIGLNYTTATVASAVSNTIPVMTFILAVLLGMEALKLRSLPGAAKLLGVGLCFGGVMAIAFYKGPMVNLHLLHLSSSSSQEDVRSTQHHNATDWAKGTFLLIASNFTWTLWMVFQGKVLAEYPCKLLFTALQCFFSTVQSFGVAVGVERDFTRWKLNLDVGLLAILYCGLVVTGVSFYLQAWCIEKKGPVFLAISLPLTLVITSLVSIILGDSITLGSILGGILMIGGLYNVMWGKRKEQSEQAKLPIIQNEKESVQEAVAKASPFHPL